MPNHRGNTKKWNVTINEPSKSTSANLALMIRMLLRQKITSPHVTWSRGSTRKLKFSTNKSSREHMRGSSEQLTVSISIILNPWLTFKDSTVFWKMTFKCSKNEKFKIILNIVTLMLNYFFNNIFSQKMNLSISSTTNCEL